MMNQPIFGKILFLIWMLVYPLLYQLEKYIAFRIRKAKGQPEPEPSAEGFSALINLVIYVITAMALYHI